MNPQQHKPGFDLAIAMFTAAGLTANVVAIAMIRKINQVVDSADRESYFNRSFRYRGKFKALFPGDSLLLIHDLSIATMLAGFIAVVLTMR